MNILVTGSRGFIGKALCRRLEDMGHKITTLSHQQLMMGPDYLKGFCEEARPDYIFHCAAYGNMANQTDEQAAIDGNITCTWNLLQATRRISYQLMIYMSTSSVYGWSNHPMDESQKLHPNTFYASTKAAAEHLCRAERKQHKKMIVTVRPFSIYGPGEAPFRFIPTVIAKSKIHESVSLMEGTHDWVYIDDFIDGLILIMEQKHELRHRTYNIGTGVATSNEKMILKLSNYINISYQKTGYRKIQDSTVWKADTTRISALGWKPKHSLEEGLAKTYEYYK